MSSAIDPEGTSAPVDPGTAGGCGCPVEEITRTLVARFGALPDDLVEAVVRASYEDVASGATVTAFLPVLTERAAAARLRTLQDERSDRASQLRRFP